MAALALAEWVVWAAWGIWVSKLNPSNNAKRAVEVIPQPFFVLSSSNLHTTTRFFMV